MRQHRRFGQLARLDVGCEYLYDGGMKEEHDVKSLREAHEQYVVDSSGKRTGVLLSLEEYRRLLEDLHDLAVVAERRDEEPISLEEMKRQIM
jgi:PHD/YefM family antitoxin component YafN of YafNO toxin-antitoxin module